MTKVNGFLVNKYYISRIVYTEYEKEVFIEILDAISTCNVSQKFFKSFCKVSFFYD